MNQGASKGVSKRFAAAILPGPALNPINTTMIAVALVPIARDTGVSAATAVWLVAGLYLVSAIFMPTAGKCADMFGPRKIYFFGLIMAAVCGLIPTLFPSFLGALIARLGIGIGTSAAYPAVMVLIRDDAERHGRDTPKGLLAAVSFSSLATATVGPVLGGVLVDTFGWQAIFLVNIPFALITLAMGLAWLPPDNARPAIAENSPKPQGLRSIDWLGIVLFAVSMVALLLFLLDVQSAVQAGAWWLVVLGVVVGAAFVLWEMRVKNPFVDVVMVAHNAPLTRTFLRFFLTLLCMYLVTYGFIQWLQAVQGFSASAAGLVQLPTMILGALATIWAGKSMRMFFQLTLTAAMLLIGGAMLVVLDVSTPLWWLLIAMAAFGIPHGVCSVANQAALYTQAPANALGSASGLSRTFTNIGAISASAIISVVYGEAPTTEGMTVIAIIMLISAGLLLVLTVTDRSLKAP